MQTALLIAVAILAAPMDKPFPLRTDPLPVTWKTGHLKDALPNRDEEGTIHVLAWEMVELKSREDRYTETQLLVLKRFHEPTKVGGHRWVLAQQYFMPPDVKDARVWVRELSPTPLFLQSRKGPELTDAQIWGYEFYKEVPSDKELADFVQQSGFRPHLGRPEAGTVNTLLAGGVDCELWKKCFGRELSAELFPELMKESK